MALGAPMPTGLTAGARPWGPVSPDPLRHGPTPPVPDEPSAATAPTSWTDTTGFKVLAWAGGAIIVLGVVLLLAIAVNNDQIGPVARVVIGLVLGLALIAGGVLLHRSDQHAALGIVLGCTGLAVEYLTIIGAVRSANLVIPAVGYLACAAVVAAAVWMSVAWNERWLAGLAFLASGLLAPAVGSGLTDGVLVFEVIMVAGGAACLLLRLGSWTWIGAGLAAALIMLLSIASGGTTPVGLFLIALLTAITWGVMVGRQLQGLAPVDPGPFEIRTPSTDPAQIARDYDDFHAHNRRISAARSDVVMVMMSLIVSSALLVLGVMTVAPERLHNVPAAVTAGVMAVIFGALSWLGTRPGLLGPIGSIVTITAYASALALAALVVMRLFGADTRGLMWLVLAVITVAGAGAVRHSRLLWPALGLSAIILLTSGPTLHLHELMTWPAPGLVGPDGVFDTAWSVVLPAGVMVIALAAAVWWSIARCTVGIGAQRGRVPTGQQRPDEVSKADEARERRAAGDMRWVLTKAERSLVMTWTMIISIAVTCYGLLAVTTVLAFAAAPNHDGYQGGQIAFTVLITLLGMLLLWQGFRDLILRVAGFIVAGLAVAKLMLFDTRALDAAPRAITFIGVGVLLLLGAMVYLRTLARIGGGPDAAAGHGTAGHGAAGHGAAGPSISANAARGSWANRDGDEPAPPA